jgi:hypothetical protein
MSFNWFSKPQQDNKTLGVTLGSKEGIKAEIDKMQGSIVKTSKNYQDNIKKYKEIAKFNQHLTKSYIANMRVIVDVSELLNSYSNVFTSLKDEFGKMETAMGKQLDIGDFEYLHNLTKNKIENLNSEFSKQAEGLKRLYAQYGKPEELNRILVAQGDIQRVIENATQTFDIVSTPSEKLPAKASVGVGLVGGKKNKSKQPKQISKKIKKQPSK